MLAEIGGAYRLLCGLGSHDLSAMRELLGPPPGVASARQWRTGNIVALLEYDDYVVTYETGVDEQLRFDAHLEMYGEASSCACSTTRRTSVTSRRCGARGDRGDS